MKTVSELGGDDGLVTVSKARTEIITESLYHFKDQFNHLDTVRTAGNIIGGRRFWYK